jgi:hypothetical protein
MMFIRGESRKIYEASICNDLPAKVNRYPLWEKTYRTTFRLRSGARQNSVGGTAISEGRPNPAVLDGRV